MMRGKGNGQRSLAPTMMVLCAVVFLGACASAKFVATGSPHPARADDCDIEIFISKMPDREYEELGIIEGEGSLGADTLEKVLPKMKREACRAGGDAMILTSNQKFSSAIGDELDDDKLSSTATVIRWTE